MLEKPKIWVETFLPPSRNSALAIAVKNDAKVNINVFKSYSVSLDFPSFFQIFCPGFFGGYSYQIGDRS